MRSVFTALSASFCAIALATGAQAQAKGELAGVVYDKSKGIAAPIANAVVSLGTEFVRTDAKGQYRIERSWTLRGYATTFAPGFDTGFSIYRVNKGQTTKLDIALTPRAGQPRLTVTEEQDSGKPVDFALTDQANAIAVLFLHPRVAIPPIPLDKVGIQGVFGVYSLSPISIVLGAVPSAGQLRLRFVAPAKGEKVYMQVFSFRSMSDMRMSNPAVLRVRD